MIWIKSIYSLEVHCRAMLRDCQNYYGSVLDNDYVDTLKLARIICQNWNIIRYLMCKIMYIRCDSIRGSKR